MIRGEGLWARLLKEQVKHVEPIAVGGDVERGVAVHAIGFEISSHAHRRSRCRGNCSGRLWIA